MILSTVFTVTLGFGYACMEAASSALFMAQLGWQSLPYALFLTALITVVGAALYSRANRWLDPDVLLTGLTLALFGGATFFWALSWLTASPIATLALFGWSAVIRSTTLAIFWMVGKRAVRRQGNSIRDGSGSLWGLFAQAVGFFLVIAAARYWTVVDVIFVAAVAYGFGVLFLMVLQQSDDLTDAAQQSGVRQRFLMHDGGAGSALYPASLSILLTQVAHLVVLYIFFARIGPRFTTAEELLLLLGVLLGSATLIAIFIRQWLAPLLWQRWGMPTLLVALPATYLLVLIASVVPRLLAPQATLMMGVGLIGPIGLYWLDSVVQYTVFGPDNTVRSSLLVYEPTTAKTIAGSSLFATALTSTGLILLLFQAGTPAPVVASGIMLVVTVSVWLLVNTALARNYPHLLSMWLRQREADAENTLRVDAFHLPDRSALDILEGALNDSSENVQLYAIGRLTDAAPVRLHAHLPALLSSTREQVRTAALHSCRTLMLHEFAPRMAEMAHADSSTAVRSAALNGLAAVDPTLALNATRVYTAQDVLEQESRGEVDLDVLTTALIVARQVGDMSTRSQTDALINRMVNHLDPSVRVAAAKVLAADGTSTDPEVIRRLLRDPEERVQSAALETAATANNPDLLPDILTTMSHASLCAKAQSLFFQAGVHAIPVLEVALLDPSLDYPTRVALIEVCGAVDDSRTTALLLAQINDARDDVRSTALAALQGLNYRAGRYMQKRLIDQTTEELREASHMITISRRISDHIAIEPDAASLLLRALEQAWLCRRDNALHRMMFLRAPRPVGNAIENLQHFDVGQRRLATETLMVSLTEEQQHMIRPFLADLTLKERAAAVQTLFPQPESSIQASLLSVKEMGLRANNDWLRSCAAYALATISESDATTPLADTDHPESTRTPESQVGPYALPDALPAEESTMIKTIQRVLFLRSVDLFRSVPDDVLAWVAEAAEEVHIPRGRRFITQGEYGDALFIVISGFTDIVVEDKGMVATRGPKSVFGEMGVLTSQPRTASCIANTEITALKLERRDFLELMAKTPQLALGIIDVLVQRLDDVSKRAAGSSLSESATEIGEFDLR